MKSEKQLKKLIRQYEARIKSGTLTDEEADKLLIELDDLILQLEQFIDNNVNKLKNKL
jgi:hypothetical protein